MHIILCLLFQLCFVMSQGAVPFTELTTPEECLTPTGTLGKYVELSSCPHATQSPQPNNYDEFSPMDPLVCCPVQYREIVFETTITSDECRIPTGEDGLCLELSSCPHAVKGIRVGTKPTHCWFKGHTPVVCCPLLSTSNTDTFKYTDRDDVI